MKQSPVRFQSFNSKALVQIREDFILYVCYIQLYSEKNRNDIWKKWK